MAMGQTVYVDVFFLINFSMDFLCYFLVSKIFSRKFSPGRGILGAALGGLYADLALFIKVSRATALLIDLLVCVLMCALFFLRRKEGKELPLYVVVYTAVSMALGGFMTALFSLLNRSPLGQQSVSQEGDGISVWIFALLALISGGITYISGRFFARRSSCRRAEVEVSYGGKIARLHAMTDTGNLLRDPVSGRVCVIADARAMKEILPPELLHAAETVSSESMTRIGTAHGKNIRVIPTRTASGERMLLALRPEGIRVDGGRGFREVDALVVLADLGSHTEGSQALLPVQLL
ncbi:MAG: sigma-E processing peptidase SpoIIGA [Clostridia bacterium]|nr:sigma-E processing peptidase SpoIIGA [Clostridia bacterium]